MMKNTLTFDRKLSGGAALVLAVILFVAVNVLAGALFHGSRIDLTEDGLYTLSQGTRNVLAGLDEPVTLRLFFSDKLATAYPGIKSYGKRVRDLLEEYRDIAGDKLRLEIIEPEPFTEAEDEAVKYGIQGAPTGTGETLYFGLVGTNSVDDQQAIPFFARERENFLEYDLTKLIYSLGAPAKHVVGIITSLPLQFGPGGMQAMMRGAGQPNIIYQQLGQQATVRMLDPGLEKVDNDIDVLLVVNPPKLAPAALYAIDQFVLGGGRAMIFVDPLSEAASQPPGRPGMPPTGARSSNLEPLFKSWGIALGDDRIVADLQYAQRVSLPGGGSRRQFADYIAWLSVPKAGLSPDDLVTGDLSVLNLGTAGYIDSLEGATTKMEPLITSSANAAPMATGDVGAMPDPEGLLRKFTATGERYVIAARITGPVKSAWPDGPPPKDSGATEADDTGADATEAPAKKPAPLSESKSPINVIVVADSDMWDDRFWARVQNFLGQKLVTPIADNASFVINGVDNLAGSDDLISLRSRGVSSRPFTVIEDIRRDAEARYLAEEKGLQDSLKAAEQRIAALQGARPDEGELILSPEQEKEIAAFRDQMLATRRQLRDVQHNLRKDIDALEGTVRLINIGLVPLLVVLVGLGLTWRRRRRMMAAREAAGDHRS